MVLPVPLTPTTSTTCGDALAPGAANFNSRVADISTLPSSCSRTTARAIYTYTGSSTGNLGGLMLSATAQAFAKTNGSILENTLNDHRIGVCAGMRGMLHRSSKWNSNLVCDNACDFQ